MTVLGALFGWSLTGYLVWRAWPGIRSDVGRLFGRLRVERSGRYAAGGRGGKDGLL